MAKVSHRGVIAIHDAGEADGQLFLAMELVRGRTLGALLRDVRLKHCAIGSTGSRSRSMQVAGSQRRTPRACCTATSSPTT